MREINARKILPKNRKIKIRFPSSEKRTIFRSFETCNLFRYETILLYEKRYFSTMVDQDRLNVALIARNEQDFNRGEEEEEGRRPREVMDEEGDAGRRVKRR